MQDKYRKIKDPEAIFNILKLTWQLLFCQNLNNFASLKKIHNIWISAYCIFIICAY